MEYHQQQDFHYLIQHQSSIILVRIKKPSLVQSCDFLDLLDLDRGPKGRICCLDSVFTFPDTIIYWQVSSKRTKCQGVGLKVWAQWGFLVHHCASEWQHKTSTSASTDFLDWKPLAHWASLVASDRTESDGNAGDPGSVAGHEDPLEKGMAIHSTVLAWIIPCKEEPGSLPSMGLQRVGHD